MARVRCQYACTLDALDQIVRDNNQLWGLGGGLATLDIPVFRSLAGGAFGIVKKDGVVGCLLVVM